VFLTKFLTVIFLLFFGVKSVYFGWIFEDMRLSTAVTGVFRSSSLQPWPCRFFLLGVWLARVREVTPWTGACGSLLVFQGTTGGFSVVLGSFGGCLLQRRSPVVARVLYAPSPVTSFPDVSSLFRFFFFFFFS
jgi:hypothetical protein